MFPLSTAVSSVREPLKPRFRPCIPSAFYSSYGVVTRFVIGLWSYTIKPFVFSVKYRTEEQILSTSSGTTLSQRDPSEMDTLLQELSEPLAAIVSNAQAGQRMLPADVDSELMEVLADIAEDGKRAGELLKRFEKLIGDG